MSALPSFQESVFMQSLQAAFAAQSTPTATQTKAWAAFNQLGLPGLRDEQWKYTQLHRLYSQSFEFQTTTHNVTAPKGIALKTVATPWSNSNQPFELLNCALNAEELLIEVADHTTIEEPLILDLRPPAHRSTLSAPRISIKLGRNSKLTMIERHRGATDTAHFKLAVMNILLDDDAFLEHCRVQDNDYSSIDISSVNTIVSRRSRYINHHFNLGDSLSRIDLNVKLQGAESYAELNGLQFATGNQVLDTHSRIEHCVPHARSSETYYGIADERGQVVFNGKVMVHKNAIGTDAHQSSRNLLLSKKAEIDTKPELEIYADDVKCSHGATVGQLDSNALFYLRSRGISEQEARALLTLAFADAVINKVPLASLREELTQQVHARFGSTVGIAS